MKTEIQITTDKPFWVFFECRTAPAFDGKGTPLEKHIFQFDTAVEMDDFISDEVVTAGESEGTYYFKILAISPKWEEFQQQVKFERTGD